MALILDLMSSFPPFLEGELQGHKENKNFLYSKTESVDKEEKGIKTASLEICVPGEPQRPLKEVVEKQPGHSLHVPEVS